MVAADFYLEGGVHQPSFHAAISGAPYSVGAAEGLRVLQPGIAARGTLSRRLPLHFWCSAGSARPGSRPRRARCYCFSKTQREGLSSGSHVLWQLRHAGKPQRRARNYLWRNARLRVAGRSAVDLLEQVIVRALSGFGGPILSGWRSGHTSREATSRSHSAWKPNYAPATIRNC